MNATAGKDLRKKSEGHKRLPNGEIEQNATPSRSHRLTELYDLPLEMLDMILQKSYLHWILNSRKRYRNEDVIRCLMSVDVCFSQRITRQRFKRSIFCYLKDIYGKTKKRSAIIKNNRDFLFENIQPNYELIASLLSHNCITQEQNQLIQRQRSSRGKNDKLLRVAESFDEANFSNFVKCLRQTNQNTVTRIMENGGVVSAFSISFVKRINTQENVNVRTVTKLRNEIYVTSQSLSAPYRPAFHVFEDQNPFNWQKKIELTGIRFAADIGSNEGENCLYVTEYQAKCVWKITIEGDGGHKISKWLKIHQPMSMSVSTDGQLLVLNSSSSLMIYGSDAKLIRSIQLPPDIGNPCHAVETPIGNFIILHQWIQEEGESESNGRKKVIKRVISELSRDGQMVIRSFIPSNETQQLNDPCYFSIDSDGRVFVADMKNNRVILLDSDLRWNRILIPTGEKDESKIHWPNNLYYGKKQLIVVPIFGGSEVNVYSISWK